MQGTLFFEDDYNEGLDRMEASYDDCFNPSSYVPLAGDSIFANPKHFTDPTQKKGDLNDFCAKVANQLGSQKTNDETVVDDSTSVMAHSDEVIHVEVNECEKIENEIKKITDYNEIFDTFIAPAERMTLKPRKEKTREIKIKSKDQKLLLIDEWERNPGKWTPKRIKELSEVTGLSYKAIYKWTYDQRRVAKNAQE